MRSNILFELLPLIGFFSTYYITQDIFIATSVCIILSWAQVLFGKLTNKVINKHTWLSTILITIFGGLTLILHNKTFVMLKPTILYWIMASSLLISAKLGKNGIKLLLQEQINLSDKSWNQINSLWVGFFIFIGILNLIIANIFSEMTWVKFKTFGGIILMLIFMLINAIFIHLKTRNQRHEL